MKLELIFGMRTADVVVMARPYPIYDELVDALEAVVLDMSYGKNDIDEVQNIIYDMSLFDVTCLAMERAGLTEKPAQEDIRQKLFWRPRNTALNLYSAIHKLAEMRAEIEVLSDV